MAFKPAPLDFAERRALQAETLASRAESAGRLDLARGWRSEAARWRDAITVQNDEAVHLNAVSASQAVDVLLAQATAHSNPALTGLFQLATQALDGLHALACNGRKEAGDILLAILKSATEAFGILAHRKPELFLDTARSAFGVPGIISPFTDKIKDNDELIEVLQVGRDYPYQLPTGTGGKGNRMKFQTPANLWAYRLCNYINIARSEAAKFARLTPDGKQRWVETHPESPAWVDDAVALKPLCPETRRDWSAVIWNIVLDATGGQPEKEEVLCGLQNLPEKREAKYSHAILATTPKMRQKKIKEALERGLRLLVEQNDKAKSG